MKSLKMNYSFIVLSIACVGITLGYTNCSDVSFVSAQRPGVEPGSGVTPQDRPPVDVVIKECAQAQATGKLVTIQQRVVFKDPVLESGRSQVCPFGEDDNLSSEDAEGVVTARYEQVEKLNLPANAVICDLTMEAPEQQFKYDDLFFLNFNDVIVASNHGNIFAYSDNPEVTSRPQVITKTDPVSVDGELVPLYEFNWIAFRGSRINWNLIDSEADNYCLGMKQGLESECIWPRTNTAGAVKITLNPKVLISVGLQAPANDQRISLVITGDNNPTSDCYHQHMEIDATVSYYIRN